MDGPEPQFGGRVEVVVRLPLSPVSRLWYRAGDPSSRAGEDREENRWSEEPWRPITILFSPSALLKSLFRRSDCIPGTRIAALTTGAKTAFPRRVLFGRGLREGPVTPAHRSPIPFDEPAGESGGGVIVGGFHVPDGSRSTMQIFGPFRVSTTQAAGGADRIGPQQAASGPAAPQRGSGPIDQLDLSSSAGEISSTGGVQRLSAAESTGGEIRVERVADLRRQIADGGYDTPEKLDAALDRLLDRLG